LPFSLKPFFEKACRFGGLSPSVAPLDHAVAGVFAQAFFKKACDQTFF